MYAVPAHHAIAANCSDLCSVLSSFRAAHRCSSSGARAPRRVRWHRAQRRKPTISTHNMRAVRRSATFNGSAKIAILRPYAGCCAMSSRLRIFSCSLPSVQARDIAAWTSLWDAAIESARAPETGFFAFLQIPLGERRNPKNVRKRFGAVQNVFLCMFECIPTGREH